jgi:molybdopterin-guanine dinucleotide biosynthesis protein A
VLGRLVDLAMADDADGAWVRTARGVEPLIAAYRRRARAAMQAAIARGEFAAHALGGVLRMRELTGAELAAFGPIERTVTNLNTPADYARVQYPPA